jgi:proteasome lid subunit RPN8/RPN11
VKEVVLGPFAAEVVTETSAAVYPLEGCGLLIGTLHRDQVIVTRAVRCANVAPVEQRTHRFAIEPRVVINVTRTLRGKNESIVGFFHSHPDAEAVPSATDLEYIRLWPDVVWLIVPVIAGGPAEPRAGWLDSQNPRAPRELEVVQSAPRLVAAACPE